MVFRSRERLVVITRMSETRRGLLLIQRTHIEGGPVGVFLLAKLRRDVLWGKIRILLGNLLILRVHRLLIDGGILLGHLLVRLIEIRRLLP